MRHNEWVVLWLSLTNNIIHVRPSEWGTNHKWPMTRDWDLCTKNNMKILIPIIIAALKYTKEWLILIYPSLFSLRKLIKCWKQTTTTNIWSNSQECSENRKDTLTNSLKKTHAMIMNLNILTCNGFTHVYLFKGTKPNINVFLTYYGKW
jgi:hypothetical protein